MGLVHDPAVRVAEHVERGHVEDSRDSGRDGGVDAAVVRRCLERGWSEPWFNNPLKPDWLVCRLTEAGYRVLYSKPDIYKWPPFYAHFAKLGWPVFNTICKIYGRLERSWFDEIRLSPPRASDPTPTTTPASSPPPVLPSAAPAASASASASPRSG